VGFLSELFFYFFLNWGEASNIEVTLVWPKGHGAKWTMPFMRYDLLKVRDLDSIITSFLPKVHCYMTNRSPMISEVFVGL
jgi:hypothetical protein